MEEYIKHEKMRHRVNLRWALIHILLIVAFVVGKSRKTCVQLGLLLCITVSAISISCPQRAQRKRKLESKTRGTTTLPSVVDSFLRETAPIIYNDIIRSIVELGQREMDEVLCNPFVRFTVTFSGCSTPPTVHVSKMLSIKSSSSQILFVANVHFFAENIDVLLWIGRGHRRIPLLKLVDVSFKGRAHVLVEREKSCSMTFSRLGLDLDVQCFPCCAQPDCTGTNLFALPLVGKRMKRFLMDQVNKKFVREGLRLGRSLRTLRDDKNITFTLLVMGRAKSALSRMRCKESPFATLSLITVLGETMLFPLRMNKNASLTWTSMFTFTEQSTKHARILINIFETRNEAIPKLHSVWTGQPDVTLVGSSPLSLAEDKRNVILPVMIHKGLRTKAQSRLAPLRFGEANRYSETRAPWRMHNYAHSWKKRTNINCSPSGMVEVFLMEHFAYCSQNQSNEGWQGAAILVLDIMEASLRGTCKDQKIYILLHVNGCAHARTKALRDRESLKYFERFFIPLMDPSLEIKVTAVLESRIFGDKILSSCTIFDAQGRFDDGPHALKLRLSSSGDTILLHIRRINASISSIQNDAKQRANTGPIERSIILEETRIFKEIEVRVLRATGISHVDKYGLSKSCYVRVSLWILDDSLKYICIGNRDTKIIKGFRHPAFNELLIFGIAQSSNFHPHSLRFELWFANKTYTDTLMGSAEISLRLERNPDEMHTSLERVLDLEHQGRAQDCGKLLVELDILSFT